MGLSETPERLLLSPTDLQGADWETVVKEGLAQTVSMLAFDAAKAYKDYIPQEVYAKWKNLFLQGYAANVRVQQAQADLAQLMGEQEFSYVVIKGESSAA